MFYEHFLLFLFTFHLVLISQCKEESPVAETVQGSLRGKYLRSKNGRIFSAFMGIPYAKPPVGFLRFKPPEPVDPWKYIKEATKVHAICPQRDIYRRSTEIAGEEDCLYLNVYTPKLNSPEREPFPVMIFFHGGGWLCGGGNSLWYGPETLLDRDVVLVVTNYRLGALGFLTTGDEIVPGNNGLKDQNLAMKWVKENIANFGGDPEKVTLFGESAGGASVHYHMLSDKSRGLFSAGISQSGTALNIWAHAPKNEGWKNSRKLAKLLSCPVDFSEDMVKCLRGIDADTIVAQDVHFMEWDFDPMIPFKPVVEPDVEGAFLTKSPTEIIKSGAFEPIPWMIGYNKDEGALRAPGVFANPHLIDEMNEMFDKVIPISLMYDKTADDVKEITKKIRKFYFNNLEINESSRQSVVDMYTDAWFLSGTDEAIRLHKKHSNQSIYYYYFSYRGTSSFSEIFGDPHNDYGVCHVDEAQYLFPIGDGLFREKKPSEEDKKMTELLTNLWVNFAKHFNPTPEVNEIIKTKWNDVKNENMEVYKIGSEGTKMIENILPDRVNFWRSLPIRGKMTGTIKDEL